jgi:outer membrane protein assembly factor BamB
MTKYLERSDIYLRIIFFWILGAFLIPSNLKAGVDTTATWKFKTGGAVYSSPTYDSGSVYIGSDDGYLYKLNAATGSMIWRFMTSGIVRCKPAVSDSVVYFDSDDGYLYAVGKNSGTVLWSFDIGNKVDRVLPDAKGITPGNYWDYFQSSPCIDSGVVYVGSGDSSFYAVSADSRNLKWKTKTQGIIRSSPCISGGMVYVGSWDGFIYAYNKNDGSVAWKYDTQGNGFKAVQPSPKAYNGIIYCGSRSGYFYALNAVSGTLLWRYTVSTQAPWVESSAAISDGVVYVGSSDIHIVHALNASSGTVIWKRTVDGDPWSSPFCHDGTVYIGTATADTNQPGGALAAINESTGTLKWEFVTGVSSSYLGGVVSSPTVNDRTIFFGSCDGNVYAVDTAFTPQPKWLAADFRVSNINGRQGFYVPSWASGSIERKLVRLGGAPVYTLHSTLNLSSSSPRFAVVRDSIPMQNGEWNVASISFSVYLPSGMPANGLVKFFVSGGPADSAAVIDTIGTQLKTGAWSTLWITKLDSLIKAGKFNPATPKTVGVVVSYPGSLDTTTWSGNVDFSNLWLYGFSLPSELVDGVKRLGELPKKFRLLNNYPNPFNPSTVISYQLGSKGWVTLKIFDTLGREVSTLVNGDQEAGLHEVKFDGSKCSSGVFFCRLVVNTNGVRTGNDFAATTKLVLIK